MSTDPLLSHSPAFAASELLAWAAAVLKGAGLAPDDAHTAADILVRTSLRGIDTHGLVRLPGYLTMLGAGQLHAKPQIQIEERAGALVCDGGQGLGQAVMPVILAQAMQRAEHHAIVAGTVKGCGHLAALGTYALQAAERGFLAVLCQSTPPIMALPGAAARAIGNNPLAFAMPLGHRAPLVFDMANSVVARGHIVEMLRTGQPVIPEGWAIGKDGNATTDPATALAGAMLPLAGHKGIGLAMLVQALAASLSQADALLANDGRGSAGNIAAFFLVINPELLVGPGAFTAHAGDWLEHYLQASGLQARYPGQRQAQTEGMRRQSGIPLPPTVLDALRQAGSAAGVEFSLQPLRAA